MDKWHNIFFFSALINELLKEELHPGHLVHHPLIIRLSVVWLVQHEGDLLVLMQIALNLISKFTDSSRVRVQVFRLLQEVAKRATLFLLYQIIYPELILRLFYMDLAKLKAKFQVEEALDIQDRHSKNSITKTLEVMLMGLKMIALVI